LQGVLRNSQASMKQCLKLVRTLRPFGGGLYALLLASLAERKPERVERVAQVFDAMKADKRIALNEWDLGPWRLLLRSYGRWGFSHLLALLLHVRTDGMTDLTHNSR
jgi:hypothetical protein